MRNDIFKKTALVCFALTLFLFSSQAFPLDRADCLDELIYLGSQLSAVTIDMYMYLGWFEHEKDRIKKASVKAINDLNEIEKYLKELDVPDDLTHLKEMNLELIKGFKETYSGIEAKDSSLIKSKFESLGELYTEYFKRLKEAVKKYRSTPKLPENFNLIDVELKLAGDKQDRETYRKAVQLIDDRQYSRAYSILANLKKKYKNLPFGGCIGLRISDCILRSYREWKRGDKFRDALDIFLGIINKDAYSPILYETFYKWRTIEQFYNHGMSNTSEIPNKKYNKKRWEIIQVIKRHLKNHPDDVWAREQVDLLLNLPNIGRGNPMGNDSVLHWRYLYANFSKVKDKKNK